jgi:hypothetical protein
LLPLSGDKDGDGELEADGPFGDESTPGPWDRRRDVRIFGKTKVPMGHGLQSDDGCKANMPWAWTGGGIPAGTFFLSPTKAEAYGKLKSEGVEEVEGESFTDAVGKDSDLKLFPYPSTPPPLDCDCKAMEQAFTAGSSSKDPLPQGTPCPPTASKVYTAADSESTERVFGSCEALRGWVPPEAETLVKAIQADGVCALQVPGDVLFRWPPSADDLRNGRGPALRLLTGERVVGVTLIARAVERPFSLGGFVLQAGVEYDESLRDVPWLKPVPLTREWREVTFRLVESQNVKAAAPLAAIALFPDLSQHFTNAENAFAAPGGPAWEVRRIELLYDRK